MGALLFPAINLPTDHVGILVFRWARSDGLNGARGGLSRGSYLARDAVRRYEAVVDSVGRIPSLDDEGVGVEGENQLLNASGLGL
jgi:hypothetical protein